MIIIRADANEKIGSGHVMRCLSIARAFNCKNKDVLFVSADEKSKRIIENCGFPFVCLNSDWEKMDSELVELRNLLLLEKPELLIVDSYYVTEHYFHELSHLVRIVYIDDLNKACWDVRAVINYNIFAGICNYSEYGENTSLILNTQYAPLRDEFYGCPEHITREKVQSIFVSAGGSDPERITERIINEMTTAFPDVVFHIIIGSFNPNIETIKSDSRTKTNVQLHINEQCVAHIMQSCDMAISASGSTLYELCACGLPTITYSLADNQIIAAEQFEKHELMLNAGDCRNNHLFIPRLTKMIDSLAENAKLRIEMSRKMQKMVDGKGAYRIVRVLMDIAGEYTEKENQIG